MGSRNGSAVLVAALGLFALLVVVVATVEASTLRRSLDDGMVATLTDDDKLLIEATPEKGEGLWAFTRRLTGSTEAVGEVSRLNRRPRRLLSGVRYKVPFAALRSELKVAVIKALFTDDEATPEGWRHRVPNNRRPTLWRITEWFTGRGNDFAAIGEVNRLDGDYALTGGQVILIPKVLLLPEFRALLPPPEAVAEEPPSTRETPTGESTPGDTPRSTAPLSGRSSDGQLAYESDASGQYGVYRLKRGEALYSSVVVRFTGIVAAREVNEVAAELARQNGIRDVTDMPVGQKVRVPLDLLLPEFLPVDDPRRQEWAKNRAESAKYSNTVRASRLEGITVILDAGHGGDDPGVNHRGTWESVYVYDVMLRAKKLLEETTAAKVVPTTRDGPSFRLIDKDVLPRSRKHRVLTSPEYAIRDTKVSANLRWYLANSQHRRAVQRTGDVGKSIFVSIHADSLHSSLRGAMVYVPASGLTRGTYGKSGSVYTSRAEVREQPQVSFSWKERTRSEGFSRQLAEQILRSFRERGLRVHREKPIRDRIIRCRRCRAFVPAVIRRNAVPAKVLLEICNMNNASDRKLLRTRAFRQQVAEALVDAILEYYGQPGLGEPPPRVAESATRRGP